LTGVGPFNSLIVMEGPRETSPENRIPLKDKVAYGVGGVARGLQSSMDNMLITPVFVLGVGISPTVKSMCDILYRVFDAFTDAFTGILSDNARTRWGRRRPFIFIGAILMAISMPILFMFNPEWSIGWVVFWMVMATLFIYLAQTIFDVPFQAFVLESSEDTRERTRLIAFTAYFGLLVQMGIAWSWKIAQGFQDDTAKIPILDGALTMITFTAVLVLVMGIVPALFLREKFYRRVQKQERLGVWTNIRMTFKNRHFAVIITFLFLLLLGLNMKWTLLFFVRYYHVCEGDAELAAEITGWGGSIQVVATFCGIWAFKWLSERIGKLATLKIIIGIVFTISLSLGFFYTPVYPYLSIAPFLIMGPAQGAMWVMVPAILGDIVDADELEHGERREGAFTSLQSWVIKAGLTIATGISGPLTTLAGYRPELRDNLPREVIDNMLILVVAGPSLFVGLAFFFLFRFKLTEKQVAENRRLLDERHAAS
jgi:GPH family glycoside/pentoside/hexuronide:cation symporter